MTKFSGRFEKRSKKRLAIGFGLFRRGTAQTRESFLVLFFKKERLP
jgi:hypothetical protein